MVYYVTHPNLSITALIDAPATEKARTTFLDYLERQGSISRADRQHWRKNMIAEKMEDPEGLTADIELHYGYEETKGYQPQPGVPYAGRLPETTEQRLEYERGLRESEKEFPRSRDRQYGPEEYVEEPDADRWAGAAAGEGESGRTLETVVKRTSSNLSPIQRKALEGFVE